MYDALADHPLISNLLASCARYETGGDGGPIVWRAWGEGPPLLLTHGSAGSWLHWVKNIPALARHFRVIAVDLPGCGESALLPESTLDATVRAIRSGLGEIGCKGPVDVAGFSSGAGFAIALIAGGPIAARNVALVGYNFVGRASMPEIVRFRSLADPRQRRAALRTNLRRIMLANDSTIDALALEAYAIDVERDRSRLSGVSAVARPLIPQLPCAGKFTAIYGARDWLLEHDPQARADGMTLLRARGELIWIPDAGHWVMYEAAETFNAILLKALGVQ
jgi:pimeloyl-ACP methyl ester carboxylesterase